MGTPVVELNNIEKSFPGVKALNGVKLKVLPGEVHGLVGENGAGKSTLIKILMGVYTRDEGELLIEGNPENIKGPSDAAAKGLGAVYQDLNLAMHLSIGENFFLGKLPRTTMGLVDWKQVHSVTNDTLKELNLPVDSKMIIRDLSPAQQEMVAIAKTVHQDCKLVVFDEPTALLTNDEVEQLFSIIRQLKEKSIGIIYISHRMEEIFTICDTVTILKDGEWVDSSPVSETNENDLIAKMVGRSVSEMYAINRFPLGEEALSVKDLTRNGVFKPVSFSVRKGEILGFFGLVGSGRTEIMKTIFGSDPIDSGSISIYGQEVRLRSPKDAIKNGIGFLPEDRKEEGLALDLSVMTNINLPSYRRISRKGFVQSRLEHKNAQSFIEKMRIKTPSEAQISGNLSGGNQQKVVISKWLCRECDIFIFDEPTVGIDVGAKMEIYRLMEELTSQGKSIILISSYLPEVMGLADRMVVIYEGQQMGELIKRDFSEESILKLASGIN